MRAMESDIKLICYSILCMGVGMIFVLFFLGLCWVIPIAGKWLMGVVG